MASRRTYTTNNQEDGDYVFLTSGFTEQIPRPTTFNFNQEDNVIVAERQHPPFTRTSSFERSGPHSPVYATDPRSIDSNMPYTTVDEYTTTYTRITRSTENLDRLPKGDEQRLIDFDEFESLDGSKRTHSFTFDELGNDLLSQGIGSDILESTDRSPFRTPRRSKSLTSFHDDEDQDYGFVAAPRAKPAKLGRLGRSYTSGGNVLKSVEKWETGQREAVEGVEERRLLRSKSERALNGRERQISPETENTLMRAQSWKDVDGNGRRSNNVQYVGTERQEEWRKGRQEQVDSQTYKHYISEFQGTESQNRIRGISPHHSENGKKRSPYRIPTSPPASEFLFPAFQLA
ncbi:uncharacterized protein LOC116305918 [Actinia tenebrosa]|uniref:Uncharacterized protein LOC116305918 n=1 Tax=Actinia tenebrosa TaxID=6105 RepID=A0A6P8J254_ACTTE|nr:uncharacterized protein LOC116305918 [Actinia tenebrosa]